MDFEVTVKIEEKVVETVEIPQQVQILVNAFKGSVVGGKK